MSSTLFKVEATEAADKRVVLRLKASPDVSWDLTDNLGFAMMLISEDLSEDAPLAAIIDDDQNSDSAWLEENVRGFIANVSHTIVAGRPGGLAADGDQLVCDYTIDVTDPAWIAHIEVGNTWDSVADDCGSEFRERAPARPER